MEELLKAILGAASEGGGAQQRPSSQPDPLAEMLGGILGGGSTPAPSASPSGAIDITDLPTRRLEYARVAPQRS